MNKTGQTNKNYGLCWAPCPCPSFVKVHLHPCRRLITHQNLVPIAKRLWCFVSKVPSRHLETLNHNLSQWEAQFVLFNAVCNCAIKYTALVHLGQRHKIDLLCLFQRIIRMNFASVAKFDNLQYDTLVRWVAWTNDLSTKCQMSLFFS